MGEEKKGKGVPSGLPWPFSRMIGKLDFAILTPTAQFVVYSLVVVMLALTIILGGSYTYGKMRDAKFAVPAPGQLVDLGGYAIHLNCRGNAGGKTVVLDADLARFSADYVEVQKLLEGKVRVCTYDRSGLGWSEPMTSPSYHISRLNDRFVPHMATELYYALRWAGVTGPLVLVGEGLGALVAQTYAARYGGVESMLLIDPYTPSMASDEMFTASWERSWRDRFVQWALAYIGIYDVMLDFGFAAPADRGYEKTVAPYSSAYQRMRGSHVYYRTAIEEYGLLSDSLEAYAKLVTEKPKSTVPVTILSREVGCSHASSAFNAAWSKAQATAGAEYAKVNRITIKGSDSMLPVNQPELVAKHVQELL